MALTDVIGTLFVTMSSIAVLIWYSAAYNIQQQSIYIAPEASLKQASGILLQPHLYYSSFRSHRIHQIGLIYEGQGQFIDFDCSPTDDNAFCIYPPYPSKDTAPIGKRISIEYFTSAKHVYPGFDLSDGSNIYNVPATYANTVMSASIIDGDENSVLFNYRDSVARIRAQRGSVNIKLIIAISAIALAVIVPGLLCRLLFGKDFSRRGPTAPASAAWHS
jgi:hypothetical protein